ncbi:MAG: hypothetical protein QXP70_04945, partial [Methanomassiliicoccales archaeon]
MKTGLKIVAAVVTTAVVISVGLFVGAYYFSTPSLLLRPDPALTDQNISVSLSPPLVQLQGGAIIKNINVSGNGNSSVELLRGASGLIRIYTPGIYVVKVNYRSAHGSGELVQRLKVMQSYFNMDALNAGDGGNYTFSGTFAAANPFGILKIPFSSGSLKTNITLISAAWKLAGEVEQEVIGSSYAGVNQLNLVLKATGSGNLSLIAGTGSYTVQSEMSAHANATLSFNAIAISQ